MPDIHDLNAQIVFISRRVYALPVFPGKAIYELGALHIYAAFPADEFAVFVDAVFPADAVGIVV